MSSTIRVELLKLKNDFDSMEKELTALQDINRTFQQKSVIIKRYSDSIRESLKSIDSYEGDTDEIVTQLTARIDELENTSTNSPDEKQDTLNETDDFFFEVHPETEDSDEGIDFISMSEEFMVEKIIPVLSSIYLHVGSTEKNMSGTIDPLLNHGCILVKDDTSFVEHITEKCGIVNLQETHTLAEEMSNSVGIDHSIVPEPENGSHSYFWKTDLEHDAFTVYDYVGALTTIAERSTTDKGFDFHPLRVIYMGDRYMCRLILQHVSGDTKSAHGMFDIDNINDVFRRFNEAPKGEKEDIMNNFLGEFGTIDIIEYSDVGNVDYEGLNRDAVLDTNDAGKYLTYKPLTKIDHTLMKQKDMLTSGINIQSSTMNRSEIEGDISEVMVKYVSELIEDKDGEDLRNVIEFLVTLFMKCFEVVKGLHRNIFGVYRAGWEDVRENDHGFQQYARINHKTLFGITDHSARDAILDSIGPLEFDHRTNILHTIVDMYIKIFVSLILLNPRVELFTETVGLNTFDRNIHEPSLDGNNCQLHNEGSCDTFVIFPHIIDRGSLKQGYTIAIPK